MAADIDQLDAIIDKFMATREVILICAGSRKAAASLSMSGPTSTGSRRVSPGRA